MVKYHNIFRTISCFADSLIFIFFTISGIGTGLFLLFIIESMVIILSQFCGNCHQKKQPVKISFVNFNHIKIVPKQNRYRRIVSIPCQPHNYDLIKKCCLLV